MAEVTGEIGGQYVELNNAATEATLKQLLAAMLAMASAKGSGLNSKEVKELEKKLKALREEAEKSTKQEKTKQEKAKDYSKNLVAATKKLDTLGKSVQGVALGMTNLITSLSKVGNSLTAAAGTMKVIPVVGGVLSGVFGAVADAAEGVYKSFKDSASVGANFGGSMTDMINSASAAGLTIDEFTGIIAKNGENLAFLSRGSESGARQLARLGQELKDSGVGPQLANLGYSTADVNSYMLQFTGRLAKSGVLQTMTTAQIAKLTGQYLKELDAVSKLTGKSKEALQQQEEARMRDAQYLTLKNSLDEKGQKNLELLMSSIPAGMQAGAKEVLATGTATTEAGRQFLTFMNQTGTSMQSLNRTMLNTGTLTETQFKDISGALQREGAALNKTPIGKTIGNFLPELNDLVVATHELSARQANIKQIEEEAAKAELERQRLIDEKLDPESMERYKQQLAATSNEFIKFLANSGLLDDLMKNFQTLVDFTKTYVLKGFSMLSSAIEFVTNNINEIAGVYIAYKVVLIALKGALFLTQMGFTAVGKSMLLMTGWVAGFLLVGYGLYKGFQYLRDTGWTVGDVFEALGDKLRRFGITYIDIWLWIAEKITNLFGGSDAVKNARASLDLQRKELDEKEKARDARRKEKAAEREAEKAKKENTKTTKENTEAKKQEVEITNEKNQSGPDWSNPIEVFKWYKAGGNTFAGAAPGASTTSNLGPITSAGVKGMLEQISRGEGTSDEQARKRGLASGYDVSLGYGAYGGGPKKAVSEMSIAEVKEYQQAMLADPKNKWKSSAVGKYQIVGKTLASLQKELGFKDTDKFDAAMQDKLGEALLKRRGLDKYTSGKMAGSDFQLALAQEWASIADPRTGRGYYAGQQNAHTSTADIQRVMGGLFAPSAANVQSAVAPEAASTTSATGTSTTAPTPVATTQESAQSLLSSLNTKLDQLIKVSTNIAVTNEKQLSVQRGMTNNVFAM